MKTLRVQGFGFIIHYGLLNIGRNYKQDVWAVELRWSCDLLNSWSLRLYKAKTKPTKRRITVCCLLAPLMMVIHWLVVPVYATLYAVVFAGLGLTMALGCIFSLLGEKLLKIGKL